MKVYLDIVLIVNFGLNFLFLMGINFFLNEEISFGRVAISSILACIMLVFFFFDYFWFQFVKVFGGFILVLVGLGVNKIFVKTSLFYFLEFALTGIVESFKVEGGYLIIAVLILILLFCIQSLKKEIIFKNGFKYNVSVTLNKRRLSLSGFLDTGNFATLDNIPIIFLDKRYYNHKLLPYKNLVIKTIQGNTVITCYRADRFLVNYNGKIVRKKVLVAFQELKEFDCLLNYNIFI